MKSIFEEMGGTYRQVRDYFIPNITLPDDGEYQIGKYGRMRRSYLKEYRKILYNNYVAWNGNEPKYDIRSFSLAREKCGKGITLTKAEAEKLLAALKKELEQ